MPPLPSWNEQRLVASDGTAAAWFGSGVATTGRTAFVSSMNATVDGSASRGAVYVFQQNGKFWTQVQKLTGKDGSAGDMFGVSLALRGDLALVGAPYASDDGHTWQGIVHVFRRTPGIREWRQTRMLRPNDGMPFGTFGMAVETNGAFAFVNAGGASNTAGQFVPRSIYVFRRDTATGDDWTQTQELFSPIAQSTPDAFGAAIAVSKDTLLVGARTTTVDGSIGAGMAYVYQLVGGQWVLAAKLGAPDAAVRDNFGTSVAIDGDTLLIGAQGAVSDGGQGAVYRFDRSGGRWRFVQKLTSPDPQAIALFGSMVRLRGNTALVGAYGVNGYRGAAYVLRNGVTRMFMPVARLAASDAVSGDVVGYYGDLADSGAVIGSYTKSVGGNSKQGAAYFFIE